jgi:hypothetical protein
MNRGLTLPSRGLAPAGFARLRKPLMSNVRRLMKPLRRVAPSILAVACAALTLPASAVETDAMRQLVVLLSETRSAQRAGTITPQSTPDVRWLVGSPREALFESLGSPDNCVQGGERHCNAMQVWVYEFFRLAPGAIGGGPQLQIRFGSQGKVQEAQWAFTQ